jgi:hypothetical protein
MSDELRPRAKKKEEDDDKKALPPISLKEGAREAVALARGGAGLGGAGLAAEPLGALAVAFGGPLGKALLVLLITAAGLGAYGVGKQIAARDSSGRRAWLFSRHASGKAGALAGAGTPDSTKFLRGDPAADAGANASADAAAAAAAAAAAEADAKAKEKADADAAAANKASDADGKAVGAGAGADSARDLAGGLLGKSKGLGVGDLASKAGTMPSGSAFASSGLSNGVGQSFGAKLGEAKAIPKETPRKASPVARAASGPRGSNGAMRQLKRANTLSRAGAASTAEPSQALASDAFGSGIGANTPAGNPGGVTRLPDSSGSEGDYGGEGAPMQTSQNEPSSGGGGGTAAPPDAGHVDASPFTGLAMAATGLLLGAGVLLLIGGKLAAHAKQLLASTVTAAAGATMMMWAKMVLGLAALMGVGAMGIGGMIASQAQGQLMMGGGLAAGGLLVTLLAVKELMAPTPAASQVAGTVTTGQAGVVDSIGQGAGIVGPRP